MGKNRGRDEAWQLGKKGEEWTKGEDDGKVCDMEEAAKYEDSTREDLIKIILDQGQMIAALKMALSIVV